MISYYRLTPEKPDVDLGIDVYRCMGAIPTVITSEPAYIDPLSPALRKILHLVSSGR